MLIAMQGKRQEQRQSKKRKERKNRMGAHFIPSVLIIKSCTAMALYTIYKNDTVVLVFQWIEELYWNEKNK